MNPGAPLSLGDALAENDAATSQLNEEVLIQDAEIITISIVQRDLQQSAYGIVLQTVTNFVESGNDCFSGEPLETLHDFVLADERKAHIDIHVKATTHQVRDLMTSVSDALDAEGIEAAVQLKAA